MVSLGEILPPPARTPFGASVMWQGREQNPDVCLFVCFILINLLVEVYLLRSVIDRVTLLTL